jgi:catechol-2,3-dioxygenase
MAAASLYFRDPDGNLLELLSMLLRNPNWEWLVGAAGTKAVNTSESVQVGWRKPVGVERRGLIWNL